MLLIGATFATTIAQDRAPSPAATTEQKVGLTDITVIYSRPSVKGSFCRLKTKSISRPARWPSRARSRSNGRWTGILLTKRSLLTKHQLNLIYVTFVYLYILLTKWSLLTNHQSNLIYVLLSLFWILAKIVIMRNMALCDQAKLCHCVITKGGTIERSLLTNH